MTPRLSSFPRRLLAGVALTVLACLGLEQLELTPHYALTRMLMQAHDVPVLLLACGLLLALALVPLPAAWAGWSKRLFLARSPYSLAMPIIGAALVAALGTRYVAAYTPVSHDEIMAAFDAAIIASGRLMAPIPPEWRTLSWALEPIFRLPVPGDVAWVSTYLPGNAAIRGILGLAFDAAIVNAILVAAALVALLGIARQLWPDRRELWMIALVLAAASSQLMGMAMTPYAATAHLVLNLIWLWLFLRNTAASHAAAIAIGFAATGLHQMVFHPLFVAPFILQLLIDRRWRLGAVYVCAYAAIGVFWIVYWQLLLLAHGIASDGASAVGTAYFVTRVMRMLGDINSAAMETMLQNILRFVAWQHPLLPVLLVPGAALAWKLGGVFRSLAAGIALTLIAMLVLLPYQDIGWGYRYAHGLIGSAALLGALGWSALADRSAASGSGGPAWGLLGVTTAAAVLLMLPIHALQMHAYLSPYTRANAEIAATKADAVIIEATSIFHGVELVRNDPYLRNRPLTLDLGTLNEERIRTLCARMSVTVFDGKDAARHGIKAFDPLTFPEHERIRRLRAQLEGPGCRQGQSPGGKAR